MPSHSDLMRQATLNRSAITGGLPPRGAPAQQNGANGNGLLPAPAPAGPSSAAVSVPVDVLDGMMATMARNMQAHTAAMFQEQTRHIANLLAKVGRPFGGGSVLHELKLPSGVVECQAAAALSRSIPPFLVFL